MGKMQLHGKLPGYLSPLQTMNKISNTFAAQTSAKQIVDSKNEAEILNIDYNAHEIFRSSRLSNKFTESWFILWQLRIQK